MEIDNDSCDEKSNMEEDDRISIFNHHPALNIPEIRQHIFSFLHLDSIKTCRLVSREWNATAEILLLKRSHITFRNDGLFLAEARMPDRFLNDFRNSHLLNKFDKFYFNSPNFWIDFEDMEKFIENFGSNMKELSIYRLNILPVLHTNSGNELIKLIPMNLTKLDVVCESVPTTLVIPMDRLKNIHTLRVGEGVLNIEKNVDRAPAPVELQLKNPFFFEDGMYRNVRINNLFDLRNLQVLRLDCGDNRDMELDLSGVINLKMLILNHVKILNWESSNWTLKGLFLGEKMKFVTATGMKFEELDYGGQMIDLAVLPRTLKKLFLKKTKIRNVEFAQNLTELQMLALYQKKFGLLVNFQNCPKLTHLHLLPSDDLSVIDVGFFPKSLKVFRLSGNCEMVGRAAFPYDTVLLEHIEFLKSFHFANEILRAKNFFVYTSNFKFVTKELIVDFVKGRFQKCFVGPLLHEEENHYRFFTAPANRRAEFLTKENDNVVVTKEIGQIDADRIRDD